MNKKLTKIIAFSCIAALLACSFMAVSFYEPRNNGESAEAIDKAPLVNSNIEQSNSKFDTITLDNFNASVVEVDDIRYGQLDTDISTSTSTSTTHGSGSVSGSVSGGGGSSDSTGSGSLGGGSSVSTGTSTGSSGNVSTGTSTGTTISHSLYTFALGETILAELEKGYTEAGFWEYEASTYVVGDLTGDGKVNNRDLGQMQKYINGWNVTIYEAAADVNFDGKINNRDLGQLQKYINKWNIPWQETAIAISGVSCSCSRLPIGNTQSGSLEIYHDGEWNIYAWNEEGALSSGAVNFEIYVDDSGVKYARWDCPDNHCDLHMAKIPEECSRCVRVYGDYFDWTVVEESGSTTQCLVEIDNWWESLAIQSGLMASNAIGANASATSLQPTDWYFGQNKTSIYKGTLYPEKSQINVTHEDEKFTIETVCKHTNKQQTITIDAASASGERNVAAVIGTRDHGIVATALGCVYHTYNTKYGESCFKCEICGTTIEVSANKDISILYPSRFGGRNFREVTAEYKKPENTCKGCYDIEGDYITGKIVYNNDNGTISWTELPSHSASIFTTKTDNGTRVIQIPCKEVEGEYHFEKLTCEKCYTITGDGDEGTLSFVCHSDAIYEWDKSNEGGSYEGSDMFNDTTLSWGDIDGSDVYQIEETEDGWLFTIKCVCQPGKTHIEFVPKP